MQNNNKQVVGSKKNFQTLFILVALFILSGRVTVAQNIIGAFNAGKGKLNIALSYNIESFEEFYKGDEKVILGLKEVSTKSVSLYSEYGITDRLGLVINLPYSSANSTNENMKTMSNLQDFSFHLKYALRKPTTSPFQVIGALGVVFPASNYDPLVPLTIGSHVVCIQGSLSGLYQFGNGFFGELSTSAIIRNESAPPVFRTTSKIGWSKNKFYGHLWYSKQHSFSGYDLGEPGSSFQTLKVDYNKLGMYVSYRIISQISLSLSGGRVIGGRNVGQSYFIGTGLVASLNLRK